jgi:hypothetical protein
MPRNVSHILNGLISHPPDASSKTAVAHIISALYLDHVTCWPDVQNEYRLPVGMATMMFPIVDCKK